MIRLTLRRRDVVQVIARKKTTHRTPTSKQLAGVGDGHLQIRIRGDHGVLNANVLEAHAERLQSLTEDGARAEGYADIEEFVNWWDRAYGRTAPWASNPLVTVIRFRVT